MKYGIYVNKLNAAGYLKNEIELTHKKSEANYYPSIEEAEKCISRHLWESNTSVKPGYVTAYAVEL